jgi:hypothetical protein
MGLVAALLERVAWRHLENKDQSGRARSQFKTYENCKGTFNLILKQCAFEELMQKII